MSADEKETSRVSRREFLKAGAAAGAFAVMAGAFPEVVWAGERGRPDLSGLGELINPFDVAVAPDGTVYVANAGRYGVVRLAAGEGRYLGTGPGTADGRFNFPMGVDVAPDDGVFVADTNNGRIQVFDADGVHVRTFGRPGYLDGEFLRPKSVCRYEAGALVADTRNHRIQYVDLQSTRLASDEPVTRAILGGLGDGPTELKLPRYVAADAEKRIYVADAGHAVVKIFDLGGDVMATLGQGILLEPAGIVTADGTTFVADAGGARVLAFDNGGRKLGSIKGLKGLKEPRGVALADGYLLVADPKAARVFVAEV
ncbi:MAG: NHL repeat-containing protein [bacterium]